MAEATARWYFGSLAAILIALWAWYLIQGSL
jgi:hypothetical protein